MIDQVDQVDQVGLGADTVPPGLSKKERAKRNSNAELIPCPLKLRGKANKERRNGFCGIAAIAHECNQMETQPFLGADIAQSAMGHIYVRQTNPFLYTFVKIV